MRGAHEGSITAMAWHPAGHMLATGSNDQMLRFWCRARPGDGTDAHQAAMRAQAVLEGGSNIVAALSFTGLFQ